MRTLLISYDLGLPESYSDYELVIKYIKSFNFWAKPLKSVWLIKTDLPIAVVRDEIRNRVDRNDKVLVIDVTSQGWGTFNISKEVIDWMRNRM